MAEYNLNVSPDLVGPTLDQEWFNGIIKKKERLDKIRDTKNNKI